MSLFKKLSLAFLLSFIFWVIPSSISACTYNSTINGNHIDIQVQGNDFTNLGVLEIISNSHKPIWGTMYQPPDVVWVMSWGALGADMYYGLIGGMGGDTAYWGFNEITRLSTIPYGIYGVNFVGSLSHDDYYVQMDHPEDIGTNYVICTRNGEVNTSTQSPISKVVFVPGLGASWNSEAILNCNLDSNSPWSLASYAEDIYNPLFQTITESGWSTLPFYYDWRKHVPNNSMKLANYINENTIQNENVNLVGHSMGGLVGRGYLEASSGGKLSSLLTVGTPNKGSALAYPPWEGGDIWNDNFIEKIALTLYLKHCGGILGNDKDTIRSNVPSIQDLLPTEPYLRKIKTDLTFLPGDSNSQNTWLRNLSTDPWGVRLGYIAGTGSSTLKTIQIKEPNKNDIRSGYWDNGKPVGKDYSMDGDGTVLAESAILPGAPLNAPIAQTHRGLVDSVEGMSKILEFLGTPISLTSNTNQAEMNSALILIGYPASFVTTDSLGQTKQDKDGMVSFINPKSGTYKLNLLPRSINTLFIVAQFLPNGEVKYKEYDFKGAGPKFKNLVFDLQNPQEDILTP